MDVFSGEILMIQGMPTGQELYDALIVELAIRRAKKPGVLSMYKGADILRASKIIVFAAMRDQALICITMMNLQYIGGERQSKSVLSRLVKTSNKHLLIQVSPESFVSRRLYSTEGYDLAITDNGVDYARRICPSLVPPEH